MKNVTNTLFPSYSSFLELPLKKIFQSKLVLLSLLGALLVGMPESVFGQCSVGTPIILNGDPPSICALEDQLTVSVPAIDIQGFTDPEFTWVQSIPILVIANPGSSTTSLSGSIPGTVQLQLRVQENSPNPTGDCAQNDVVLSPTITITVLPNVTNAVAGISSGSSPLCENETITLSGSASSSSTIIHSWSVSPEITPSPFNSTSIFNPTFTAPFVSSSTDYTITYNASNAQGCMDEATLVITVNPPVAATISNGLTADICLDGSLVLNGNPSGGSGAFSGGASSHVWELRPGTTAPFLPETFLLNDPNSQTPIFMPPLTGDPDAPSVGDQYVFRYTATDNLGCESSNFAEIIITVKEVPDITTTNNAMTICSGDLTDISVSNPNAAGTDYSWELTLPAGVTTTGPTELSGISFGGGTTTVAIPLTNGNNNSEMVTITITPFNGECAGSPDVLNVTVEPAVDVEGSFFTSGRERLETVCDEEQLNLTLNSNQTASAGNQVEFEITNVSIVATGIDPIPTVTTVLGGDPTGEEIIAGTSNGFSETFDNPNDNPITVTFTLQPQIDNLGANDDSEVCSQTTFDIVVSVEPTVDIQAGFFTAARQRLETVCDDGQLQLTLDSDQTPTGASQVEFEIVSVTFSDLDANTVLGGDPAGQEIIAGTTNGFDFTFNNTTNDDILVTFTLRPELENVSANADNDPRCANTNFEILVTVEPEPIINITNITNLTDVTNFDSKVSSGTDPDRIFDPICNGETPGITFSNAQTPSVGTMRFDIISVDLSGGTWSGLPDPNIVDPEINNHSLFGGSAITHNSTSNETATITIRPYLDVDGSFDISMGDCIGDDLVLVLEVEPVPVVETTVSLDGNSTNASCKRYKQQSDVHHL